ncbi:MAG TPA: DinB family protein [Vicinamibacterales bacterium]|jgi:hypothetical protein
MAKTGDTRLAQLLDALDEAFDRMSWHGANLRGALRAVKPVQASWRSAPGRHNIWELAVHAAYWKYAVRRKLTGEARGTFALEGSNWFARPVAGDADPAGSWRGDVRLLIDEHRRLRQAVMTLDPGRLDQRVPRSKYSAAFLIRGVTAHDLYHAGQIQLLKRLQASGKG